MIKPIDKSVLDTQHYGWCKHPGYNEIISMAPCGDVTYFTTDNVKYWKISKAWHKITPEDLPTKYNNFKILYEKLVCRT